MLGRLGCLKDFRGAFTLFLRFYGVLFRDQVWADQRLYCLGLVVTVEEVVRMPPCGNDASEQGMDITRERGDELALGMTTTFYIKKIQGASALCCVLFSFYFHLSSSREG